MKGISIKKLAAVAAGAVLIGTAIAPFAGALDRADVYSADGTPKVKVAVGSIAAVSDAVWAGNIAAKIASMAYSESDITCSAGEGEASCALADGSTATVDLTVGGTSVVSTEQQKLYKVRMDSVSSTAEVNAQTLTNTHLPFLKNLTANIKVDNNSSSINEEETLYVNADAKAYFNSTPRDLITLVNSAGDFKYTTTFNGTTGINLGTTSFTDTGGDDSIPIYFFGEKYFLSKATLTGTKEVRLVSSSQKDKYFTGDKIEGLAGDGDYADQEVAVEVAGIVGTSATTAYTVTFNLVVDGEVVYTSDALSSTDDLKDNLYDPEDNYAIKDSVYIDSVLVDQETGKGYVLVTVGANTIVLRDGREYPYDSTSVSSDADYWRATITSTGNYLKSIAIQNQDVKWDNDNTYGPLFPTTSGQSLTGADGVIAEFGAELEDGTLGKGFAKIEFKGFDYSGKTITTVELGKGVSDDWASGSVHGGLRYTGYDDTTRYVPFYYQVDDSGSNNADSNTTFTVYSGTTPKIVYQSLNKGTLKAGDQRNDYNITIYDLDIINGQTWDINNTGMFDTEFGVSVGGTQKTVAGSTTDYNIGVGQAIEVDGTTFTVSDVNFQDGSIHATVDGYIILSQTAYYGNDGTASAAEMYTHSTDTNHVGKIYFTEGSTFDASSQNLTADTQQYSDQLDLDIDSTRAVFYAVRVTASKVYYLLDAQALTAGDTTNGVIQSTKKLIFDGTSVPDSDGTYTEDAVVDFSYYVPKIEDYNKAQNEYSQAAGAFTSSKAYFMAQFKFQDYVSGDVNVSAVIDTYDGGLPGPFTNDNLAWPDYDANYLGSPTFTLKSDAGSHLDYYQSAYVDSGTKVVLTDDDTIKITSPDTNALIQIVVYGDAIVETTTGGQSETGIAEGDTFTTDAGTEIKIDAVTVDASCEASGGSSDCSPSSTKAIVPAAVGNLVYLDSEAPSGSLVIIGGPLVNTLAQQYESEIGLNADGDKYYQKVSGGDIVVAGFSKADTVAAAKAFIAALDALE